MRRIIWFLLLLGVLFLTGLLWWKSAGRFRGTLQPAESNFALSDTGRINRVRIIHHDDTLVLNEEPGGWKVNGKHGVRQSNLEALHTVVCRLNIKAPVEKARQREIKTVLEDSGKQVYLMQNSRILRHYLMIHEKEGDGRTIMKLNRARQAFYMEIPGYPVKNISYIFNPDEEFWRDPVIFDFLPSRIRKVELIYRDEPRSSFRIAWKEDTGIVAEDPSDGVRFRRTDTAAVKRYLSYFVRVEYEDFIDPDDPEYDRISMEEEPYARIFLELMDGTAFRAGLHRIPVSKSEGPGQQQWDFNHFYLKFDRSPGLYLVPYMEFDPILKKREYFTEPQEN